MTNYKLAITIFEALFAGKRGIEAEGAKMTDVIASLNAIGDLRTRSFALSAAITACPIRVLLVPERSKDIVRQARHLGGEQARDMLRCEMDKLSFSDILSEPLSATATAVLFYEGVGVSCVAPCEPCEEDMAVLARLALRSARGVGAATSLAWIARLERAVLDRCGGKAVRSQLRVIKRREARETRRLLALAREEAAKVASELNAVTTEYDPATWALLSDDRRMEILAEEDIEMDCAA